MLFNFMPTGMNPQEMMVYANDQIEVYNFGHDGWITGRCIRTSMIGLVPQSKFDKQPYLHICPELISRIDYTNAG
jgi:hypothetical protein